MHTVETRFWSAVDVSDWTTILREGQRLLRTENGPAAVDLAKHVCYAMEKLGRWVSLADVAYLGIDACVRFGIYDDRYAALVTSLGRGYWDRQLYTKAIEAYSRLYEWAAANGDDSRLYAAKYSIACCMERTGDDQLDTALEIYAEVFRMAPDWSYRIASAVNEAAIWMMRGEHERAYDLVTTRFLMIPVAARTGASWADLLRVLSQLEVYRNRPDVALIMIYDAIEAIPNGRSAVAARCHAVRALAEHAVGNCDEADAAIELAWSFAEQVPGADTCRLIREVEKSIKVR